MLLHNLLMRFQDHQACVKLQLADEKLSCIPEHVGWQVYYPPKLFYTHATVL